MDAPGRALELRELPSPEQAAGQVLLRVLACGVCRTDLHVVDGELPHPKLPLVPGHQIVGEVIGESARFEPARVSASPGSARHAASAVTAEPAARTSATMHASPGTTSTAALRSSRRGRALLLPDPGRLCRRAGCPASLRRSDRLPVIPHGRRRGRDRSLRLRGGRSHRLSDRRRGGPRRVCGLRVQETWFLRSSRVRSALSGPAHRGAARRARRRDHLRARRRARSAALTAVPREVASSAPAST